MLLFISPFIPPLRILQLLILNVALAEPYIAAAVMLGVTPVVCYKILGNNVIRFSSVEKKICFISMLWLGYAALTLLWVRDFPRFYSEYIQLILLLLLTIAFVHTNKTIDDLKTTNFFLIFCGCLVSLKCFFNSFDENYVQINYYAFISLVTCIAIPISFVNFKIKNSILFSTIYVCIGFLGIIANESRATTLLGFLLLFIRFFFLVDIKKYVKWIIGLFLIVTIPFVIIWFYNMSDDNILKSVTDVDRNYSNLERLALLNQSLDIYLSNLFGVGFGSTNSVFMSASSYSDSSYPHPHNSLAHIAVELGTFGIFIFIFLFYLSLSVIMKLRKNKELYLSLRPLYKVSVCLVVVMFIFSFLDDMFFNGMFNFYCMIFFGYLYSLNNILYTKNVNNK